MRRIILVRHGSPLSGGVCYGRLDVPTESSSLLSEGLCQSVRRALNGDRSRIWSSPSERCLREANIVAADLGATVRVDERLMELNFGHWEGRSWQELESLSKFQAWMQGWMTVRPPGGETLGDLTGRVAEWLAESRHAELRQAELPQAEVVFTHAGVIRQLLVTHEAITWPEAMARKVPYLTPIALPWLLTAP